MLSTVGRRACASTPRILRTLGGDGGSAAAAAVDQLSGGLGLGFSSFFSGPVVQGGNAVLLQGSPGGGAGAAGFLQVNQVRGFIQLRTNLEVADNSGARRVQCIKVMKGSNAAQIGDTIMASVKDAQPRGKVKKGEVVTCVVVRAATHKMRRDGSEIRFDKNAVVLVNKQGEPIGTRIFGPVPHELRRRKLVKILTLAEHVA